MKTLLIKKSKSGLMFTEIVTIILVVVIGYGSYLYVPLLYKSQELDTLVKEYTFKTGQATEEMIRAAVVEDANSKLNIILNPEDVIVEKGNGRTKISAKWNAFMELPFGYVIPHTFTAEYDRKTMIF